MRTIDADHLKSMLHEYVKREQSYIEIENSRSVAMGHRNGLLEAIAQIAEEPTIEPQRMRGGWIRNDNGTYSCSICQSWIPEEQHYYAQYCLHCGADMREE